MVSVDGTATCNPRGFLLPGKHDKRICDMLRKTAHWILLWGLFFLICFGLGYPTLNRYDPRKSGNPDAIEYYQLVEGNPQAVPEHSRYRVLVPYLAKPFYWLAEGQVGTWNPVFFGLLVANSIFSATSACLLVIIRSEEHTSELQSQSNLVCRLLLEKKKLITTVLLYLL